MPTRILLGLLAALLALSIAQADFPVEAKKRPRTVTRAFRNPAEIDLPVTDTYVNPARLYPSPIAVRGLKGTVRDVNLTLNGLTHNAPKHVYVLLAGPRGQTAIVMARVGGSNTEISNVTLRLDDEAAAPIPQDDAVQSGAYRPTNPMNSSYEFPDPAPEPSGKAALSVFDGTNPNGSWRLFVLDEEGPLNAGKIAGGWEIEITAKVKSKKRR